MVTSGLTLTRFIVLFCESYSVVRLERQADIDLIELCGAGAAKDSHKFRAACMQARSEQAAPVLLKAILKSIRTAFVDFVECFNSPSRIVVLILFCLSGLALPIVKALSTLATTYIGQNMLERPHIRCDVADEDNDRYEVVVLNNNNYRGLIGNMTRRLKTLPQRNKKTRLPMLLDMEEEGNAEGNASWGTVVFGKED